MEKIEKQKFFHIVIPAYNLENCISKCIDSILSQSFKDVGITVVDDVSTDKTAKIVQEYAQNNENVELLELREKRYSGTARNVGYRNTKFRSNYTWFVDGDDWIYRDSCLQVIFNAASKDEPDAVFFNAIHYPSNVIVINKPVNLFDESFSYCAHQHYVVRTNIVQPYLDGCSYGEDVYHNFLQFDAIKTYKQIQDIVYVRNSRKESLTHDKRLSAYLFRQKQIPILFDALDSLIQSKAIKNPFVEKELIERASHRKMHTTNVEISIKELSECK